MRYKDQQTCYQAKFLKQDCTSSSLTINYSDVPQWILYLIKGKNFEITHPDIWKSDSDKLKWMEEEGLYFPSFELRFHPVNASTASSKVSISFTEITHRIELPLLFNIDEDQKKGVEKLG